MHFIIPWEIYPFDVMVCIGENRKAIKKLLDKQFGVKYSKDDHGPATAAGRTVMFPSNATLIRLDFWPITSGHKGELAHEVFHAVSYLMDRIGMGPLNIYANAEAYAYAVSYLTQRIYEKVEEGKKV